MNDENVRVHLQKPSLIIGVYYNDNHVGSWIKLGTRQSSYLHRVMYDALQHGMSIDATAVMTQGTHQLYLDDGVVINDLTIETFAMVLELE